MGKEERLRQLRSGYLSGTDREGFPEACREILIDDLRRRLWKYFNYDRAADAEDISQTLIQDWFHPQMAASLAQAPNIFAFLRRAAHNRTVDFLRKEKTRKNKEKGYEATFRDDREAVAQKTTRPEQMLLQRERDEEFAQRVNQVAAVLENDATPVSKNARALLDYYLLKGEGFVFEEAYRELGMHGKEGKRALDELRRALQKPFGRQKVTRRRKGRP